MNSQIYGTDYIDAIVDTISR